jgi:hypothetical protein
MYEKILMPLDGSERGARVLPHMVGVDQES